MERAQEIARSQPDPEALALQPVATDRRRRTRLHRSGHGDPGAAESVVPVPPPPVTGPPQLPPAILRLQQCLADHGVEPPYDVAAIGLDRVAAALSAWEHLDSDAPSSMGPTWLHAD